MPSARVQSVAAIAEFRAALIQFAHEVRKSLDSTGLEVRRGLEWIVDEQPRYWQQQIRVRGDEVLQAKNDLHRCRSMPAPDGHIPSCIEQKKALEKAQRRLREAEEKLKLTRQWGRVIEREVTEYDGRSNQLAGHLDAAMPRAVATLDRILATLESYLAVAGSETRVESGVSLPPAAASMSRGGDGMSRGDGEPDEKAEPPADPPS